jgi:DnaK suppressor protein
MNPELTPEILAELRAQLEAKRDTLRETIAALRADQDEDDAPLDDPTLDAPGDRGDDSVDLEERDENNEEERDLRNQLSDVEYALSKFGSGTYGICEACGRPIPLARLRVLPEARYDIEHQREREAAGEAE